MRRLLLICSVFTLGAGTLVACSGFSSSETNESSDASAVDGSTLADDSQVVSEGGVADSGVADSGRKLRVFVTSSVHQGNFQNGAVICDTHARDAGLNGRWLAWLSNADVSANDSLRTSGPWWDVLGTNFAAEVSEAGVVKATSPISLTEHGAIAMGETHVWTGTQTDGGYGSSVDTHCAGWNSVASDKDGIAGDLNSIATWTDVGAHKNCAAAFHLYCFELE